MKSYSQFSESLNDLYLKEWEKLDEDTQKEFIRQFAEENNIELDEEVFTGTAIATSPYWVPAALAGAAYLGWKAPGWMKKHQNNKEAEKFLSQSSTSNIPPSSRTNDQRAETANTNNNKTNTNNNKNEKEERNNEKESGKINKEMQNRNNTNQNKPPSNWKKFKNRLTNNPVSNTVKTAWNNPLKTFGAAVGLDYAGKKLNPNLRTPNNNNGVTTDNNNNNKETKKINPNLVPYKEK